MNEDHKEIYLEPQFVPQCQSEKDWYDIDGRQWCEDNVWHESDYSGVKPTRYIRADIHDKELLRLAFIAGAKMGRAESNIGFEAWHEKLNQE